jgi:sortase (surface protein transpeptidase)
MEPRGLFVAMLRRRGRQRRLSLLGAVFAVLALVTGCSGGSSSPNASLPSAVSSSASPSFTQCDALSQLRPAYLAGSIKVGEALARLVIPSLKVHALVVQGTTQSALEAGIGHYAVTPLPERPGNVAIAGHRVLFGAPFRRLAELRGGDEAVLTTPVATYIYRVFPGVAGHRNPWLTSAKDYSVVSQAGALGRGHSLTLTTSASDPARRVVVRLSLSATKPPRSTCR